MRRSNPRSDPASRPDGDGDRDGGELLREIQATWNEVDEMPGGSTAGDRFDREQLHEERLGRYRRGRDAPAPADRRGSTR